MLPHDANGGIFERKEKDMSKKQKAIIVAALALVGALFGWYVAYSDGDPTTKPETEEVVQDVENLTDAIRMEDTESGASEVVEEVPAE